MKIILMIVPLVMAISSSTYGLEEYRVNVLHKKAAIPAVQWNHAPVSEEHAQLRFLFWENDSIQDYMADLPYLTHNYLEDMINYHLKRVDVMKILLSKDRPLRYIPKWIEPEMNYAKLCAYEAEAEKRYRNLLSVSPLFLFEVIILKV
ncbi:MAG: hypothetical protein LBJ92_00280 [Holosporales bacterium]|jgi:hypothetical protein|nr:hypothetical protein [Holosporales bacterium]